MEVQTILLVLVAVLGAAGALCGLLLLARDHELARIARLVETQDDKLSRFG